ncbi:MAG: GNAT family N-acetyltransferase [Candidatus Omnitrophica bacterium]|nr:GNAT family N-acetyltransferase [Candidatus Omnitrophota bacterium]MDD5774336.1 GNAT family N-acetyltransferase [Candidatus Omnitrophota bacterium]
MNLTGVKIYIITEGGKDIGFGHITRCRALYEAFVRAGACAELIVNTDAGAARLLSGVKSRIMNWLSKTDDIIQLAGESDMVIIDSYLAEKSLYDRLSLITRGKAVMIDDYNRLDYPAGIVVNPSAGYRSSNYPPDKKIAYLTGNEYIILRKEFWKSPARMIRNEIRDILVTFGGTDVRQFMKALIAHLSRAYPGATFHIVTDMSFAVDRSASNNIRFYSGLGAPAMRDLMLKCDLCISGGGQTLYELCRTGIPVIGICLSANQKHNLKYLSQHKIIEYAGSRTDAGIIKKIDGAIESLCPQTIRRRYSDRSKRLFDGRGALRIAEKTSRILFPAGPLPRIRVRKARRLDCRDLWLWRNHPAVRKWSFNQEGIQYSQHARWFQNSLNDKNIRIFIAHNDRGKKTGQVRVTRTSGRAALVSVNLNPSFIGKGIGSLVINVASRHFFAVEPAVKELKAEIFPDNTPSRIAFKRAGYVFSRKAAKMHRKVDIYTATRSTLC